MKIKIVSNYDSDGVMYNSLLNCFENNTPLELVQDESYNKLIIINGYRGKIKVSRDNVFGFLQEPEMNSNYDRNLHFYCHKIFCQSKKMFSNYKGIKEVFLPMFYRHHETINREYFTNFNEFSGRKKLCLIVSSISNPNNPNWTNHNYGKRHEIVRKMLNSDLDFDFYGRGWSGIGDRRYKGQAANKHEILRGYEYSIAIENVCEKNYVSEKMFDCFLNNTIPIYHGCPNVTDIFKSNSFVELDLDRPDIIDFLKETIKIDSTNFSDGVITSKQTYFEKLNLFDMLWQEINKQ